MKRRSFLHSTLAATCFPFAAMAQTAQTGTAAPSDRQLLAWRHYRISTTAQHDLVSRFLETAALPALGRLGVGPVGVFAETGADATLAIYTLVAFDSFTQVRSLGQQLAADDSFQSAGADYLSTAKDSPAYDRIDNQLMIAFSGFPRVVVPRPAERIFELRIYESHNEQKARLKIEMFNEAEFSIFRRVGLNGVFFGETLFGANLPNLAYMLVYSDMAEHGRAWEAFRADPEWIELRDRDRYRDTVSKIESRFLRPISYSQI